VPGSNPGIRRRARAAHARPFDAFAKPKERKWPDMRTIADEPSAKTQQLRKKFRLKKPATPTTSEEDRTFRVFAPQNEHPADC